MTTVTPARHPQRMPLAGFASSTVAVALVLTAAAAPAAETAVAPDPQKWQQISDDEGIVVYQQREAGLETVSMRGEAVIDAPPEAVFEVMSDNSRVHEWIPMVAAKRDLEQVSDQERIEFTHVKMPWPLTDRQFINRGRVERLEAGRLRIHVESVDRPEFVESGKVLGRLLYSEFMLTPRDQGLRTHMVIEVNSDPKGLIPKWLVNRAQRRWPRDFFNGLRRQLDILGRISPATLSH